MAGVPDLSQDELEALLLRERLDLYVRLRGGYTFPLAGATYWGALAVLGYRLPLKSWLLIAFITSGLIFPLAIVYSKVLRVDFLSGKSSVDSVIGPAFVGMLLFWPMAFAAYWTAPALAPLILAIGMSAHWPVIGWSYGRPALFSAHAIVRTLAVFTIWVVFPAARTTWLPAAVAVVYIATAIAILLDVRRLAAGTRA